MDSNTGHSKSDKNFEPASSNFGCPSIECFNKNDERNGSLIQNKMTITWPERVYRSALGLICHFYGSTNTSEKSTLINSVLR